MHKYAAYRCMIRNNNIKVIFIEFILQLCFRGSCSSYAWAESEPVLGLYTKIVLISVLNSEPMHIIGPWKVVMYNVKQPHMHVVEAKWLVTYTSHWHDCPIDRFCNYNLQDYFRWGECGFPTGSKPHLTLTSQILDPPSLHDVRFHCSYVTAFWDQCLIQVRPWQITNDPYSWNTNWKFHNHERSRCLPIDVINFLLLIQRVKKCTSKYEL